MFIGTDSDAEFNEWTGVVSRAQTRCWGRMGRERVGR
jgi:hypothetical protein